MTPKEGKDSDSSDSRKTFIILVLTISVDSVGFFFPLASAFFLPHLLWVSILLAL